MEYLNHTLLGKQNKSQKGSVPLRIEEIKRQGIHEWCIQYIPHFKYLCANYISIEIFKLVFKLNSFYIELSNNFLRLTY